MTPLLDMVGFEEDIFHIGRKGPCLPVESLSFGAVNFFRVDEDGTILGRLGGVEYDIANFVDVGVCPIGRYSISIERNYKCF